MPTAAADLLSTAQTALQHGDWTDARRHFEEALADEESPDARLGLGEALWWLGQFHASLEERKRAYAGYRARGDRVQAASVAVWMSISLQAGFGNLAASSGWAARAERLLDDDDPGAMAGWALLARACGAADAAVGEPLASDALSLARRFGDTDLELCALSERGWWLVAGGKVDEGFACLDEAAAGSLAGEVTHLFPVVFTSCTMLVAATRCGDFVRAVGWVHATETFIRRYGGPYLFAHCRSAYGGVLLATGAWEEAEHELLLAVRASEGGTCPPVYAEALGRLCRLWVGQGRVEEAAQLLAGFHDETCTALARAEVRVAQSELVEAISGLTRRLSQLSMPSIEGVSLLGLLVEINIGRDDLLLARETAERLEVVAALIGREAELAVAALASGRVARAEGDSGKAVGQLQASFDSFCRLGMPFDRERARLELARALACDDPQGAIAEARLALAGLDALGARPAADAAAEFVRSLGGRARSGPIGRGGLTGREAQILELLGVGLSNPDIATRLCVSRKTVEHHVGNILSKLGLSGRAAAAAYVLRTPTTNRARK